LTEAAVRVAQLRRSYQRGRSWFRQSPAEIVALDGLTLEIPQGEIHGLLGPNGAGKSTLCKVLATIVLPTSGTAEVLGFDVVTDKQAVRERISLVLGGERGLYYHLSAWENLRFWAALYGLSSGEARTRSGELLERVGLLERAADPVETYSRGMKQRLHLARGLIANPQVMILDEPTMGMDPVATVDFRSLLREVAVGRTVLFTTHDMVEAEMLCNRVSVINRGELVATEAPQTLAQWTNQYERIDVGPIDAELVAKIEQIDGVGRVITDGPDGGTRVETVAAGAGETVLRLLLDNGHTTLRSSLPSLEEVYFHLLDQRVQQS